MIRARENQETEISNFYIFVKIVITDITLNAITSNQKLNATQVNLSVILFP